jgi:hypothetical protein
MTVLGLIPGCSRLPLSSNSPVGKGSMSFRSFQTLIAESLPRGRHNRSAGLFELSPTRDWVCCLEPLVCNVYVIIIGFVSALGRPTGKLLLKFS